MLSPQPFFEPRGSPLLVLWRLRAMSQLGHTIDLATYHVGQDVSIPGVSIHRTPRIPAIKSVRIGPSPTKLFLDVLLFIKAFRLLRNGEYDLLFTNEEASFLGIILVKLFGIRHLYDMHSSLPDLLTTFQYGRFRPLIRIFQWLERKAIASSDAIITAYPELEEHVKRIDQNAQQVMIESVADEGDSVAVSEADVAAFRASHQCLDGRRVVLYTGNFLPYQGLDLLINSAKQVLRQRDDVAFLLVGGTQDQVQYHRTLVEKLGIAAHFHFTGVVAPEEIPLFVKISDVLVSPRTGGTNTPLKIFSYLQSGKPIVATNLYTHTQVLNNSVSVMVEPEPDALAAGILSVLDSPVLADKLGSEARRHFENNYSVESFIEKTQQALRLATQPETIHEPARQ